MKNFVVTALVELDAADEVEAGDIVASLEDMQGGSVYCITIKEIKEIG